MPAGRPTKYTPDLCDKVVEWGRRGKSKAWMCGEMGISWNTHLLWEKAHPEFMQALEIAEMLSQRHWEDLGHDNITSRELNAAVWSRSMAARFPKHWREKQAIVGGDDGDNPIKAETTIVDADAFASRVAGLAARLNKDGGDGGAEPGSEG